MLWEEMMQTMFAEIDLTTLWSVLKEWGLWITIASVLTSLIGMGIVTKVIIGLPTDYFLEQGRRKPLADHPVLAVVLLVLRNLAGLLFFLAGIAMNVLPGPGLLTMVLGLSMMNFPGRHRLINWLLSLKQVRKSLNWIRKKAHQPSFEFIGDSTSGADAALNDTAN